MGLGSTISRGLSVASSSNYEPSYRSGSASTRSTRPPTYSTGRASTVTSATSMSKIIRSASSASTSRESTSASISSTLCPPTVASRTPKASNARTSAFTSTTSTSRLMRSASTASTLLPQTSAPPASINSLRRSASKRAPSYFSTAASRLLWGRPPPGHSTLQPSQIAALTHTLSLPIDTPMLSSIVGALDPPISRSQFSPVPDFCDAHFFFEQKYIDELTEVIAHEIGPQLDKLRIAPKELISKKTARLLSILQPYQDIFTSITDTSSILSMKPTCKACTLSRFFQNPKAVKAVAISVKSRKHRAHPWPGSIAWLEPSPGKGVDWETKWRTEGKSIGQDRVRVQRWRRENRVHEAVPEDPHVLGHQPGEGCDFCDALRMEQADEAELDAAIAEEEEEDAERAVEEGLYGGASDNESETTLFSNSETIRATEEESIIKAYLRPTSLTTTTTSIYHPGQTHFGEDEEKEEREEEAQEMSRKQHVIGYLARIGEREDEDEKKERKRRASEWARSYQHLVGRRPDLQTTLQFQLYPEPEVGGAELRAVEGWI